MAKVFLVQFWRKTDSQPHNNNYKIIKERKYQEFNKALTYTQKFLISSYDRITIINPNGEIIFKHHPTNQIFSDFF